MGDLGVNQRVSPNDLALTSGPLDRLDLDGGKLRGEKVASGSAKFVHRLTTASICSIFEDEADFHIWIAAQNLNPDQALGINGLQDPLDGVVANILDGDLKEGIAILIKASDDARWLTLLVDCLDVFPRPNKTGILVLRNISELLVLLTAQV